MSFINAYMPLTLYGGLEIIAQTHEHHRFNRKNFDGWVFEAVIKGVSLVILEGKTYEASAGDMYILPDGKEHTMYPKGGDCHKVFFHVAGSFVQALLEEYTLTGVYYFPKIGISSRIRRLLQAKIDTPYEFASRLPLMFHEFVVELHRFHFDLQHTMVPKVVKDMTSYLNRHIEKPLSLDEMADDFGCSKVHIIRQFKPHLGCTPWEYLLQQRLEQAKWLLANSHQPIKEISSRLQFRDPHYFSHFFKKRTHKTPLEFRRENSLYYSMG